MTNPHNNPAFDPKVLHYYAFQTHRPVIALDADGVKVNYLKRFAEVWEHAFGEHLEVVAPNNYFERHVYGIPDDVFWSRKPELYKAFDTDHFGWARMDALPRAVEACRRLVSAGFELVSTTAMPAANWMGRKTCLDTHGFPIAHVVTCERDPDHLNPKRRHLMALRPAFLVDDFPENFFEIDPVRKIFVNPPRADLVWPQRISTDGVVEVESLIDFAEKLLALPVAPGADAWARVRAWDAMVAAAPGRPLSIALESAPVRRTGP